MAFKIGTSTIISDDRELTGYATEHNVLGSISGDQTIDLSIGNYVSATSVGNINWTFSNPIASPSVTGFVLELTNGGAFVQTWPASSVRWPGGSAPTLTEAGTDILVFVTDDGGTNWRGNVAMLDSKAPA